jgi:hypothetical protein
VLIHPIAALFCVNRRCDGVSLKIIPVPLRKAIDAGVNRASSWLANTSQAGATERRMSLSLESHNYRPPASRNAFLYRDPPIENGGHPLNKLDHGSPRVAFQPVPAAFLGTRMICVHALSISSCVAVATGTNEENSTRETFVIDCAHTPKFRQFPSRERDSISLLSFHFYSG